MKIEKSELVAGLKKDHLELSSLVSSFQNALAATNKNQARKILSEIVDATNNHFKFEQGYLYPRLRRLISQTIDKLDSEQKTIKGFIDDMRQAIMERGNKNRLHGISKFIPVVSQHLKDCDDLVVIAEKFSKEEKEELSQKFKEHCIA